MEANMYQELQAETGNALSAIQRLLSKLTVQESQMLVRAHGIEEGNWFSDGESTWIVMAVSPEGSLAHCMNAHGNHETVRFGLAEIAAMNTVSPSL